MNFFEELKWRGLIKDVTDEEGFKERLKSPMVLYVGIDPTADSLHIGHIQQLLLLKRYQLQGHTPIALLGGATGMIGDPRPTTERKLLSIDEIRHNGERMREQMVRFLSSTGSNALISLNNYDWLSKIDLLSFLRDYGKYFNVNTMINKETIQTRLETGISYTEFTYTILQAIDFLYLYQNYQCELQIGGSDQWGNIVSGTDLIRKQIENSKVFGVTSPLIMNSDGTKFGKSEGKNVWMDSEKTSPYQFYQYWLNVSDQDVIDFMKRLSFKSPDEIQAYEHLVETQAHLREAQKALAAELVTLVHGDEALVSVKRISEVFFSSSWDDLNEAELEDALSDAPQLITKDSISLIDALVEGAIVKSKREARDLISSGSISVNGLKQSSLDYELVAHQALYQKLFVIRRGKKTYFVVRFEEKV
jgi:tyrosyl-tRNA synthetase